VTRIQAASLFYLLYVGYSYETYVTGRSEAYIMGLLMGALRVIDEDNLSHGRFSCYAPLAVRESHSQEGGNHSVREGQMRHNIPPNNRLTRPRTGPGERMRKAFAMSML